MGWNAGEQVPATLQEILSQPVIWRQCLDEFNGTGVIDGILRETNARTEWVFIGCGSSFYLAEAAAATWTLLTGQAARALPASEPLLFPGLAGRTTENTQVVVISRSGQTSEAVRAAHLFSREYRVPTLGITCSSESLLEKSCDRTVRLPAADEKSMVMTRSFSSMLLALQSLAARKSSRAEFSLSLQHMSDHFAPGIGALVPRIKEFVSTHAFADYVF